MRVRHRTCEKGQPRGGWEPGTRRVRTHRCSEVDGDEELLLALISFLWSGIHSRSLGLREIGAQFACFDTPVRSWPKLYVHCSRLYLFGNLGNLELFALVY